ncbi:DDE-type integrase/transposase/recombinase [Bradyrhizobium sp. 157]|uniref:DDE-type integrase/transposase/recombinase n=1 Tax=Bradyrhizobium sp. 157 TaxID=2782631 RepID=UPI001FFAC630|nr:DDE-type integrase/transposase/recombinase [Bradyrhizobium sp. 157]MCK1641209.1 DDE-type integrase/transposase/recombinase [Bradyrhizobium sp. 157]
MPIAPNLIARDFTAPAPNRVWLADITYIPTAEGWLYLAAVMDLFSRKIVGWAMRDHMQVELASAALTMAIQQQRPPAGLIHHSDRGVQYASNAYRDALSGAATAASMSRKAACYAWLNRGKPQAHRESTETRRFQPGGFLHGAQFCQESHTR